MCNAELPFVHTDDCKCCLQHNKFKQRIINEKVDTPTTTVYRCVKHVLGSTAQCLLLSSGNSTIFYLLKLLLKLLRFCNWGHWNRVLFWKIDYHLPKIDFLWLKNAWLMQSKIQICCRSGDSWCRGGLCGPLVS